MKATIIAVFSERRDGRPIKCKSGPGVQLLLEVGDRNIYDTMWLTEKAHFRVKALFSSIGLVAPDHSEINAGVINCLQGAECDVTTGENDQGYPCIKYYNKKREETPLPPYEPLDLEIRDNNTDASASVEDEQSAEMDPDLDEDVPF